MHEDPRVTAARIARGLDDTLGTDEMEFIMGSSKSYRGGPAFTGKGMPTKTSQGDIVEAGGTHQSGYDEYGRKGHGGRSKSKSGKTSTKNKGPHGQS